MSIYDRFRVFGPETLFRSNAFSVLQLLVKTADFLSIVNRSSYKNIPIRHYLGPRKQKKISSLSHYFFVFMEPPDFSSLWHFGYFDDYSSLWNPSRIFKKLFVILAGNRFLAWYRLSTSNSPYKRL